MDGDPLDLDHNGERVRLFLADPRSWRGRIVLAAPSDVMAVVAARLRTALDTLPDDPETIALNLAQRGIRGEQCNAGDDPLSRYLSRACGHDVSNDGHAVTCDGGGWSFTHALPPAACAFVAGFDAEEWPYLRSDYTPWAPDGVVVTFGRMPVLDADTVAALRPILGLAPRGRGRDGD